VTDVERDRGEAVELDDTERRRGTHTLRRFHTRIVLAALVMVQSVWHDGVLDRTQAIVDLAVFASVPVTYLIFRRK